MQSARLAIDPLWSCLCPGWAATGAIRANTNALGRVPRRAKSQCLRTTPPAHARRTYAHKSDVESRQNSTQVEAARFHYANQQARLQLNNDNAAGLPNKFARRTAPPLDLPACTIRYLYNHARAAAQDGKHSEVRRVVEHLVKERGEKPNSEHYHALILANVSAEEGAAWRAGDLLAEMQEEGLQPENAICHAVLKVLSVHPDHLMRADMLEYMRSKWMELSEDGLHDVTAGMLREGLFEQALERLDHMKKHGITVEKWLLDMFVYMLCEAGEVEEAYQIMNIRHSSGELNISRALWSHLLDAASMRHHADATTFVWKTQVNTDFINPSSGTCLNILTTASRAGDAALATDCFGHLAKRGSPFDHLHYQLLMDAYLNATPPDTIRAMSILTIMVLEKLQPGIEQTRGLYLLLRDSPELTATALQHLRDLHAQGRKIPIAALNLLIECYVTQRNLPEAMKIYKLIHTFTPINEGPKPTFANIDTFNLLLRGCRTAEPPDEEQASFLVSELLALRVKPTALTYDRLILVFVTASEYHLERAHGDPELTERANMLLDWATRHFFDMQPLDWMPRFGTIEKLSIRLAQAHDERCWDVLQLAEDAGNEKIDGWAGKGKWARKNAGDAWARSNQAEAGGGTFQKATFDPIERQDESIVASASA